MNNPEKYMGEALLEAREALIAGEFPVGCVMVYEDEIVSRGTMRKLWHCENFLRSIHRSSAPE
jgi:tRNA(Arg) A34 adenosine deaminase TadA